MEQSLLALRQAWAARLLVWITRAALAVLFIPTGITKMLGVPFQRRSMEPWILPFFDALYAAGPYWRFLGLCEVLAGVFLLVPRLAVPGAMMYAAIAANLVAITASLGFRWTAVLATSLMLAASLGLLLWDWPVLKPIFSAPAAGPGSFRADVAEAWRHTSARASLVAVLLLWLLVHVLDRAGAI